jgi:hypothetical protein
VELQTCEHGRYDWWEKKFYWWGYRSENGLSVRMHTHWHGGILDLIFAKRPDLPANNFPVPYTTVTTTSPGSHSGTTGNSFIPVNTSTHPRQHTSKCPNTPRGTLLPLKPCSDFGFLDIICSCLRHPLPLQTWQRSLVDVKCEVSVSARISKGQWYQGFLGNRVGRSFCLKKGSLRCIRKNFKNEKNGQNFTPFRVNKMFSHKF